MLEALSAPFSVQGEQLLVRASVGVAVGDAGHASVGDLLRKADVAMYAAKHGGQGRAAAFDPSMDAELQERLHLETELQRALAEDALDVVYQPVVDLARARWWPSRRSCGGTTRSGADPARGVRPGGRAVRAGHRGGPGGARSACRRVAALPHGPAGPVSLAVNLSAPSCPQAGFVEDVLARCGGRASARRRSSSR